MRWSDGTNYSGHGWASPLRLSDQAEPADQEPSRSSRGSGYRPSLQTRSQAGAAGDQGTGFLVWGPGSSEGGGHPKTGQASLGSGDTCLRGWDGWGGSDSEECEDSVARRTDACRDRPDSGHRLPSK